MHIIMHTHIHTYTYLHAYISYEYKVWFSKSFDFIWACSDIMVFIFVNKDVYEIAINYDLIYFDTM